MEPRAECGMRIEDAGEQSHAIQLMSQALNGVPSDLSRKGSSDRTVPSNAQPVASRVTDASVLWVGVAP